PEGGTMPAEYFQWLGIPQPLEEGEYLLGFSNYLTEKVKDDTFRKQKHEELRYQMTRADGWPLTARDEPEISDWLARNEKPLDIMVKATLRNEYFNPLVPKGQTDEWQPSLYSALLPNVQKCRETAAMLTARSMLRISEGKFDDAWLDLL